MKNKVNFLQGPIDRVSCSTAINLHILESCLKGHQTTQIPENHKCHQQKECWLNKSQKTSWRAAFSEGISDLLA